MVSRFDVEVYALLKLVAAQAESFADDPFEAIARGGFSVALSDCDA